MFGGKAQIVNHRSGTAGPDQASRSVGSKELWVRHSKRTGERAREDAQERDEAAEKHRPHSPFCEQLLRQRDMARAEVLRKTLAHPLEQRHAISSADRVSDGV